MINVGTHSLVHNLDSIYSGFTCLICGIRAYKPDPPFRAPNISPPTNWRSGITSEFIIPDYYLYFLNKNHLVSMPSLSKFKIINVSCNTVIDSVNDVLFELNNIGHQARWVELGHTFATCNICCTDFYYDFNAFPRKWITNLDINGSNKVHTCDETLMLKALI